MKRPTHAMLALAASAIFTTAVFAADTDRGTAGQTPASPAGQTAQGQGEGAQQAQQQQGQQVDQAALQQIRQFAQDPKTACDKLFVLHTAVDNMFEIQISQLAGQRAQSPQVKQLAQKMVQDHEQLSQRLMPVAQTLGVQIPQALPQMKQAELQIFASLSGKEFDEHFIAKMHAAHDMDVAAFEGTSALSQNAQVKQFATESLPTLKEHRQMVHQAAEQLGIMKQDENASTAGAHIRGSERNTPARGSAPGTNAPTNAGGANSNPSGTDQGGANRGAAAK